MLKYLKNTKGRDWGVSERVKDEKKILFYIKHKYYIQQQMDSVFIFMITDCVKMNKSKTRALFEHIH